MDYKPLTENQKKVLEAVLGHLASDNIPPSLSEIQKISGLKSLRGVTLQLEALENLGYLERKPGARGILINKSFLQPEEKVSIPLMTSTVPAGYGSPATDHTDRQIEVSLNDTKGLRNAFAVRVSGESMIGVGIEDGDYAIISPQPMANSGDIVAALYENGVTLKRYRIVDGIPMLLPANPKFKPILDEFQIQGKLINILKQNSESVQIIE